MPCLRNPSQCELECATTRSNPCPCDNRAELSHTHTHTHTRTHSHSHTASSPLRRRSLMTAASAGSTPANTKDAPPMAAGNLPAAALCRLAHVLVVVVGLLLGAGLLLFPLLRLVLLLLLLWLLLLLLPLLRLVRLLLWLFLLPLLRMVRLLLWLFLLPLLPLLRLVLFCWHSWWLEMACTMGWFATDGPGQLLVLGLLRTCWARPAS